MFDCVATANQPPATVVKASTSSVVELKHQLKECNSELRNVLHEMKHRNSEHDTIVLLEGLVGRGQQAIFNAQQLVEDMDRSARIDHAQQTPLTDSTQDDYESELMQEFHRDVLALNNALNRMKYELAHLKYEKRMSIEGYDSDEPSPYGP